MIDKIYIPTYRRAQKQKTFNGMPKKWQKRSVLVIAEDEYETLKDSFPVLVCPCQGKGPEGSNPLDYGLSPTRKWIAELPENQNIKYAVFDDDVSQFVYTRRPSEPESQKLVNQQINFEGDPKFDDMMDLMSSWLDEVVTCGLEVTWNPPFDEDSQICWRQTVNHFYNGKTFPVEKIDFTSLKCAQDYYILLQLLTMGYPNKVSLRYRIRPELTSAPGGCEEYRTIEVHNESMRKLQEKFPNFVSLKEKVAKTGKWGGIPKLAANIQWKKAYKSSQVNKKPEKTLAEFF